LGGQVRIRHLVVCHFHAGYVIAITSVRGQRAPIGNFMPSGAGPERRVRP
jgi:hypothetical protein